MSRQKGTQLVNPDSLHGRGPRIGGLLLHLPLFCEDEEVGGSNCSRRLRAAVIKFVYDADEDKRNFIRVAATSLLYNSSSAGDDVGEMQ